MTASYRVNVSRNSSTEGSMSSSSPRSRRSRWRLRGMVSILLRFSAVTVLVISRTWAILLLSSTHVVTAQTFTYAPAISMSPSISSAPSSPTSSPTSTGTDGGTTLKPTDIGFTMAPVTDAPSTYPPSSDVPIPVVTNTPTRNPITSEPSSPPIAEITTSSPTTSVPSRRPTSLPTTRYPTRLPTRYPTRSPTEYPTTLDPTYPPSPRPTTRIPTRIPTELPTTHRPSPRPTTRPPSSYPTDNPVTLIPTRLPTTSPTISITTRPTTRLPTFSPHTEYPTVRPSPTETALLTSNKPATLEPATAGPTIPSPTSSDPTITPSTIEPTSEPTVSPTTKPTSSPSRSPVIGTASPTESPSSKPSSTESNTPTYLPTGEVDLIGPVQSTGLAIIFTGIGKIPNQLEWESITSKFFEDMYDDSSAVYDAKVEVMITRAGNTNGRARRLNNRDLTQWRGLQSDSTVEVTYTQTLWYSGLDPNLSLTNDEIAQLPLSTDANRDEYVGRLKSTLDGYESLTAVSEITVTSDKSGGGDESNGFPLPAIIGIAAGSVALMLILFIGFVYYKKKTKHSSNIDNRHHDDDDPISAQTLSTQDMKTSLGAAGGTGSSLPTYGDQSVATVDYDYSRAFGGVGGDLSLVSDAGGTLGSRTGLTGAEEYPGAMMTVPGSSGNTIFSDDPTFDQAYEDLREEVLDVYAPAGKLGVVIDTPDDGAPVIHAVKDTSPIFNKVQVGDKLVAVDDEDVRSMTAIKVSKLISRKSNNASRKLTVIRHVTGR